MNIYTAMGDGPIFDNTAQLWIAYMTMNGRGIGLVFKTEEEAKVAWDRANNGLCPEIY